MSLLRRIAVPVGLAVAAGAIAIPLTTGTSQAAAPSALSAFTSQSAGLGDKVPAALKTDLKAAWAAPDGQRMAALTAVLDKAVAGTYGDQVKTRATRLQSRLAQLDPAVKKDLAAAVELPKAQRQAAFKAIKAKADSGGYGAKVQRRTHLLERLLKHRRG